MTPVEIRQSLEQMTVLVDTREQQTPALQKRLYQMGCPYERRKLEFGDYSAQCPLPDGNVLDLSDCGAAVERKMSLDELCMCFCRGRARFEREFQRAKGRDAKLYLLVENATWEHVYAGRYRTRMAPKALLASITAWLARYDCQLLFCKAETSGRLIREVLYRELKERLEQEYGESAHI